MNWLNDFYSKQYQWAKEKTDDLFDDLREDLVKRVKANANDHSNMILDLGSGLGQFAVASAKEGYDVTAVELTEEGVRHTKQLAKEHKVGNHLHVLQENFYAINFKEPFDVVCYWDGFGIGSDEDQKQLLKRISSWLKPGGVALVDIYTPWYWAKTAGQSMGMGDIRRQYDFDAEECKMIDTWWVDGEEDNQVTQYLRCYSPADLKLLLNETDLVIETIIPGGAVDYENFQYEEKVPLNQAMQYMVKLKKLAD
ncbi:SAM-dependent methyltransferase [Aquisalibacillus elongatus]|uniref:Methyltransferase family protein n=1 Tax=Aquisalibacillus elongatus TaxID=485577 RepID=A0A3N5AYU6_9BACI|nr:class I SAM-dependent methyltransferase [Aquisalibacillus elongatus]RPF50113.1 methyltransferase family protein [Aquisalibacillus elongatus]